MLRQMERSAIHVLAKRGKSQRQIAKELGHSRVTVARALREPVDKPPARRARASQADPYRPQIEQWVRQKLTIVRMLELARADPERPYRGGRTAFNDLAHGIKGEISRASADVPIRFEGLPGEYLQVDWGEVRQFPFTQQDLATRYFLACRLKWSRWSWVRFTGDMRQETLIRGLVECLGALGFVPWVLVFDNMKTVTSGRDAADQPIWTPALRQLAAEFGFHPQACDPAAGNQKGSVESLVKWVKGNFLPGREFLDDHDLTKQAAAWTAQVNLRPSDATDTPPMHRLPAEAAQGGVLPPIVADYGVLHSGRVTAESLVHVQGNAYSVLIVHVGAPVTVRLHQERVRIWRDAVPLADHARLPDGSHQRSIDPAHFAPLFAHKRRAQVMCYRAVLLGLGGGAASYISEVSRRRPARLREEVLGIYALYERWGTAALLEAMTHAVAAGTYGADALDALLTPPPAPAPDLAATLLALPGVPRQHDLDRLLSSYEAWVEVDVALLDAPMPGEEAAAPLAVVAR